MGASESKNAARVGGQLGLRPARGAAASGLNSAAETLGGVERDEVVVADERHVRALAHDGGRIGRPRSWRARGRGARRQPRGLVALNAASVSAAEFNPDAAAGRALDAGRADPPTRGVLAPRLPPRHSDLASRSFHASATDPGCLGLRPDHRGRPPARRSDRRTRSVLVGHTHGVSGFAITGDGAAARGAHAPGGHTVDLASGRWLLNPGSVGQPRDADPRAAYLLLDLGAGRAEFRRVEYPVDETQAQMRRGRPTRRPRAASGVRRLN